MQQATFFGDDDNFDWSTGVGSTAPATLPSPADWLEDADFGRITPHHYQREAFLSVWRDFDLGRRSTLVVMPTGSGKTILVGMIFKYAMEVLDWRCLFLAHRGKLLEQAAGELAELGIRSAIEKADQKAQGEVARSERGSRPIRCVVGSVQSLQKRRLAGWPTDYFGLMNSDEAHHSVSASQMVIHDHFGPAKHVGVTATPTRADGTNLGRVFENLAFEYSLYDAVREEFLCRLVLRKAPVRVDLKGLRTVAGDFNKGQLEDRINAALNRMVPEVKSEIEDRKTMVFTPDRRSAWAFAEALRNVGVSAKDVHGETPDQVSILREFSDGEFQVLCSCDLLTEGYNEKPVSCIVLARPTKSESLLMQMIGRGTRNYPGKENCRIIDFDWLVDPGVLANPVHLIAPRLVSKERMDIAKELVESGQQADLLEAIEEAEGLELEAKRLAREKARAEAEEKERLRISIRERQSTLDWRSYDPLGVTTRGSGPVYDSQARKAIAEPYLGVTISDFRTGTPAPLSEGQRTFLGNVGFTDQEMAGMTRRLGQAIGDDLSNRRKMGLATYKQLRWLIRHRVEPEVARRYTKDEASALMTRMIPDRRVG